MTLTEFLLARISEDEDGARMRPREWWSTRLEAECEAKRRIALRERNRIEWLTAKGEEWAYAYAVIDLASVYADHPDYRQEWKP